MRQTLAEKLMRLFRDHGTQDWPWCEKVVTYSNAKLPHALLLAGSGLNNDEMLKQGFASLEWLTKLQTVEGGRISLIGNQGWLERSGKRARFDQQPIEAMAMVQACSAAYRISRDEIWFDRARAFLGWFTSNNEIHVSLYDYHTGGSRDGLRSDGVNMNQGAESTLAWLLGLMTVMDLNRGRTLEDHATAPWNLDAPKSTASQQGSSEALDSENQTPAHSTSG
jgi:hypothetical protein